ncbi:hypothetical protein SAMN05216486_10430 [bacterium JGI 053]|nr:hypothetical protein SAMN05216486_10430 [bacterium JGI 053]
MRLRGRWCVDTKQRLRNEDGSRTARADGEAAGAAVPPQAAASATRRGRLLQAAGWICLIAVAAPWLSRAFIPVGRAFSSDVAIPILMVRARHWSFFDVYFWGQDRLGSWHLLLMRAACQATGCTFYHAQLHLWATVWLLCGIAVLSRLAGSWRFAAAGLFAAVLVGDHDSRAVLFDASQPYAWQLTALLLAWWGMRKLAEGPGVPGAGRWRLRGGTAFAAFLAHWTSPLSGPLLLGVAGIEAVRGRAVDGAGGRSVLRRWSEGALAVGVAVAAELALRMIYYSPLVGQPFYRTSTAIDRGHLGANALKVLRTLARSASFPLLVVGTAGAVVAGVLLWRALRAGRRSREPWRLDGAALVLAFWAMAAAQLPVLVLLRHVRIAQFGIRYFTLIYVFGALAGLLTVAWAAAAVAAKKHRWREALALAGAAGVVAGVLRVQSAHRGPDGVTAVAARLEALAPGAPLLGGFWTTYAFSARQRPETMLIPVPCEGRSVYAPWWLANLRRERYAVVANTPECEGFGAGGAPPPWIHQHGTLLRLARPRIAVGAGLIFSVYENVTARALPRTAVPADTAWRYCDPGAALRLSVPPGARTQVIVARALRTQAASLFAAPVFADGTTGPAVRMGRVGRLYRAELRGKSSPVVGARITARPAPPIADISKCTGVKAYVVPSDSGS